MSLPFSKDQFFAVFAAYNEAVAPAQVVLLGLAIAAAALALRPTRWSDRAIGAVLGSLWLWMGIEYHWRFFQTINPAARAFAAAFLVEAALLFWYAVLRQRITFQAARSRQGGWGLTLLVYAIAVYPALGWALGHRYPASATFGLPCPTTIATLGFLLWSRERPPLAVMVVPWAWALIASTAAFRLGTPEDLGLSGALVVSMIAWFADQSPRTTLSSPAST